LKKHLTLIFIRVIVIADKRAIFEIGIKSKNIRRALKAKKRRTT
jgi:hypothetical protein